MKSLGIIIIMCLISNHIIAQVAGFNVAGNCVGQNIVFANTSTPGGLLYEYDYGDPAGVFTPVLAPFDGNHVYAAPGTYPCTLRVTYPGPVVVTFTQNVVIDPLPVLPNSFFHQSGSCTQVQFQALGNLCQNLNYQWNFGDGTSAVGPFPPTHNYPGMQNGGTLTGEYPVTLQATDPVTGCVASNAQNIHLPSKCNNIDFSCANLQNWAGENGDFSAGGGYVHIPTSPMASPVPAGVQTLLQPVGGLPDGNTGNLLMSAPPGKTAYMLGDDMGNGSRYNVLRYTVSVDPYNSVLLYSFAAVFEETNTFPHSAIQRPKVTIDVIDAVSGLTIGCAYQEYYTNPLDPLLRKSPVASPRGEEVYYRGWTTTAVDLSAYMGQDVILEFRNYDCVLGGHASYAYVTAECTSPEITVDYCLKSNQAILSAPAGFSYDWYYQDLAGVVHNVGATQEVTINNPDQCTKVWVDLAASGCAFRLNAKLEPTDITADFNKGPFDLCLNAPLNVIDASTTVAVCDPNDCPKINAWTWDFGDGSAPVLTQNPASHVYAASGLYQVSLEAENDRGCKDQSTDEVYVWDPQPDFSFTQVCVGNATDFNNTSIAQTLGLVTDSIVAYDWDFGDATPHGTLAAESHTYAAPGVYNVTLTIKTSKGCFKSINKAVNVYALPVANFATANACLGQNTAFIDMSVAGAGVLNAFLWNFGDGGMSAVQNPNHTYAMAGNYMVQLAVTNTFGCIGQIIQNVTVEDPKPLYTCAPVCLGQPSLFVDQTVINGTAVANYDWDFNDGSPHSNLPNPSHVFAIPGNHFVTLEITTPLGCTAQIQQTVVVHNLPQVQFIADKYDGCPVLCVNFTDKSTSTDPIVSWSWNIDNYLYQTQHPTHCFETSGFKDVQLTLTSNLGCVNTLTQIAYINVFATPSANFSYSPTEIYSKNPEVQFTNLSSGAISYQWGFDQLGTSTATDPIFLFPLDTAHIYTVCLEAMGDNGCPDTACKNIEVKGTYEFLATNTFTPNNDGINDDFRPLVLGVDEQDFTYWIYNRWGQLIFTADSYYLLWDGKHQGKLVKEDVYVWKVRARPVDSSEMKDYYGHVLVIVPKY